ncbi:hypothetical protein RchiOBHm_Chr4g0429971 [Rosa chinensis]|uniref:Uncharacterized protein n=1 Tax=Rosa chinensis TaxID=74649 RepID=A0A2P6R0B3_ROSCH|nr:uncharacterized protein LOC112198124 [Rosa chinensis]PRQ39874.1 hypothetical protein RchiOBHm_Chr4g0429971 [Rosa chinensis]
MKSFWNCKVARGSEFDFLLQISLIVSEISEPPNPISMESKHQNVELIDEAIKRLLEERRNNRGASGEDKDDHLLLSQLLSQLESAKGNSEEIQKAEASNEPGEVTATPEGGELEAKDKKGGGGEEFDKEEIVKELKNLKRQNTITHLLLSVMVVLTIAWQASEVTLLLKMKHGLSHPFSCIRGLFSGGSDQNGQDQKRKSDALPSLKMPDLPSVELPDIGLNGEKH